MISIGIRCRYSEEGKRVLAPRLPDREGIIRREWSNTFSVKWDGLLSWQTYHKRYIQRLDEPVDIDMRGCLGATAKIAKDSDA